MLYMEYKGSKFDMYQFVLFDNILSDRQSFLLSAALVEETGVC